MPPRTFRKRALPLLALTLCAYGAVAPSAQAAPETTPETAPATVADPEVAVTAAETITTTVNNNGTVLALTLTKVALRGPGFEVLLQDDAGALAAQQVTGERSYFGTVEGHPDALVSAIIAADGTLRGQISFDRGEYVTFADGEVTATVAAPEPDLRWGSPVDPSGIGTTIKSFDLGIDVTPAYYTQWAQADPATALDLVEESVTRAAALSIRDLGMRPTLSRVVLRGSTEASPYAVPCPTAPAVRGEWNTNHADAAVDLASALCADRTVDGSFEVGFPQQTGITFDISDDSGPAAGPAPARFDEDEVARSINSQKRLRNTLDDEGTFTEVPMPPYAADDSKRAFIPGPAVTIDAAANDHDSNGEDIAITAVAPTSALGGTAVLADGKIVYTPPAVLGTDRLSYTLTDSSGATATGWVTVEIKSNTVTYQSPGSQSSVFGDYAEVMVEAADSADNQMTYSVKGMPPGLLMDPFTGLIFGVPLKTGVFEVTARATAFTGAAQETTFTWVVARP